MVLKNVQIYTGMMAELTKVIDRKYARSYESGDCSEGRIYSIL